MINSWVKKVGLLGFMALALPLSGTASPVLVPLDVPTFVTPGFVTINIDTQEYLVNGYVSDFDFYISTNGSAMPYSLFGSTGNLIFCLSPASIGLLGPGVTVDATLVSANPGSAFQQDAYFFSTPPLGTHYIGFQSGTSYGFFEIGVGSMTVVGYGFESTPGAGIVTTAVPEPMVGGLVLAAVAGALAVRRYSSR